MQRGFSGLHKCTQLGVCPQKSAWTPAEGTNWTFGHMSSPILYKYQMDDKTVTGKKVNNQASTQSKPGTESFTHP